MTPRQKRIEELGEQINALRTEMLDLEQIEADDLTDEHTARMEVIPSEFDTATAERDQLVEAEEAAERVRQAAEIPANRHQGAPSVIVRTDPFEDVESVRFRMDDEGHVRMGSDEVIDRARSAFEDTRHRGVTDAEIEALLERIETVPGAAEHALVHGSPAYRSAFGAWVNSQGANTVYTTEEADAVRAALSLSGANGGYTLPTLLDPTLIKTGAASKNPVRQIATVVQGIQNVWHGVTVGNVTSYWTAEATAMTDGNPTFGNPAITASKMTAYLPGSFEIFEDSALQAQLPALIAESFDYLESDAFVVGSGSGAPNGVVTAVTAVTASRVSPTTGGTFTTASAVDVFKLLNAIPSRYEDSATWMANKITFNTIKQMSTGSQGSYFWTDFNDAVGSPLLGSPVKKSSSMVSAVTTGSNLIVLGDFSQYIVFDRIGTVVEFMPIVTNSSGLPTGQRALVAHKRVGGDAPNPDAFRVLKL